MIININTIVITIIIIICRSIILSCQRWSIVAMKYQSPVSLLIVFDILNVDWQCNKNQSKVIIGLRPDAVSKRERDGDTDGDRLISIYLSPWWYRSIHSSFPVFPWMAISIQAYEEMMKKYKMFVFKLMQTMKTMKL